MRRWTEEAWICIETFVFRMSRLLLSAHENRRHVIVRRIETLVNID